MSNTGAHCINASTHFGRLEISPSHVSQFLKRAYRVCVCGNGGRKIFANSLLFVRRRGMSRRRATWEVEGIFLQTHVWSRAFFHGACIYFHKVIHLALVFSIFLLQNRSSLWRSTAESNRLLYYVINATSSYALREVYQ